MATSTPDAIEDGEAVLIDAPIFIYHFTGVSQQCRRLLERCERGDVRGHTSASVLAEVTHRLMVLEAIALGLVARPNAVAKLRSAPKLVQQLGRYSDKVAQIPLMGIVVHPLDLPLVLSAADLRARHGLMTNDSIIASVGLAAGLRIIASRDSDFADIPGLQLCAPSDVRTPSPS